MHRIRGISWLSSVIAILIALFFTGFAAHATIPSALHSIEKLAYDTVTGHHLASDYYGLMPIEIWYSFRLIATAIIGAYLIAWFLFFFVYRSRIRWVRTPLMWLIDILETIPESAYIIGLVMLVIFLIEQYQLNIPGAFPVLAPKWSDTWIPAATLALPSAFYLLRTIALNYRDEWSADYTHTARSKGAGERRVFYRHVLPNLIPQSISMIPTLAVAVISAHFSLSSFSGTKPCCST